ncbi:hypothetical protein PFBG_04260 [Plasmodium falciparum 7G8]|nr:hypothetical protein PFBG_04260 [Plasmodium falciparum 7G8]
MNYVCTSIYYMKIIRLYLLLLNDIYYCTCNKNIRFSLIDMLYYYDINIEQKREERRKKQKKELKNNLIFRNFLLELDS